MRNAINISLKDNTPNKRLRECFAGEEPATMADVDLSAVLDLLRTVAGRKICELPVVVPFPSVEALGGDDGDESGNREVFSILGDDTDPRINTHNCMGVLRLRSSGGLTVTIEIGSRFDAGEKQLFLNYMLHKVFGGGFVEPVEISQSSMWDILLILVFCKRLEDAYAQGLFKRYERFEHNDTNFRGCLNLNEHLRQNIPFCGTVAYTTREFSYDNPVTRLIQHTLHHIGAKYRCLLDGAGSAITEATNAINQHTPHWCARDVVPCIRENLRPIQHAYFSAYEPLRRACLAILEDAGAALYKSEHDQEAEGVVFDGSWLWENYVAVLLRGQGFKHYDVFRKYGLEVFTGGRYRLYPDFHHPDACVVLDAKYKRAHEYAEEVSDKRTDVHQLLAYMFLIGATHGGLVFPKQSAEASTHKRVNIACGGHSFWKEDRTAHWHDLIFQVPTPGLGTENFIEEIARSERRFVTEVEECLRRAASGSGMA